jgi:hypothetical protein
MGKGNDQPQKNSMFKHTHTHTKATKRRMKIK